ncbi:MAG TPA: glucosamine-6-phosphate deaminase [Verrucomicrobiae bacterium]|nr:glucosamine-6-phosphate deaminase [Verrucomicrobiae bacterium]
MAEFRAGNLTVRVYKDKRQLGAAAAGQAASILERQIRENGAARILISTGNSQLEMIAELVQHPEIDWRFVEMFHIDEYVGLAATHPASFRYWVKTRLADPVQPGEVHYLAGDAGDVDQECRRYAKLLARRPVDLAFVGFGENGHIGFNDPHEADFHDPLAVRRVTLDEKCRLQQVGEGHFPSLDAVPTEALTLTCPTLVSAREIVCCVPDQRKAEAVRNALQGPIAPSCPASILRNHPRACVYLDTPSASLLA